MTEKKRRIYNKKTLNNKSQTIEHKITFPIAHSTLNEATHEKYKELYHL